MSENTQSNTLSESPYPGLRYYRPDQSQYFAARSEDVEVCYDLFARSRILILHGTTGCGKSSFLRAGLKPYIEQLRGENTFAEDDQGELQVLRSGGFPLEVLTYHIYDEVMRCKAARDADPEAEMHGGRIKSKIDKVLEGYETPKALVDAVHTDPTLLLGIIEKFEMSVQEMPAIVIDQAEEVFTLNVADVNDGYRELTDAEVRERTEPYFAFLASFAREALETKIIISLRTEYKGQFDDRLDAFEVQGEDRPKVYGFHLPDIDEEGMMAAITRPTELKDSFQFDYGVPELIVSKLVEDIPPGGRLPVLQVTCQRLWLRSQERRQNKLRFSSGVNPETYKDLITEIDVSLMGSFTSQIREYLRDRLREMSEEYQAEYQNLSENNEHYSLNIGGHADKWMAFFREVLVELQADGRATTKKLSHEDIINAAAERFGADWMGVGDPTLLPEEVCNQPGVRSELDWLARDSIGILRKSIANETTWMLGHDSLGLVLERWHQINASAIRGMMMEMTMPMPYYIQKEALFDEVKEVQTISIPDDPLWDRYILEFAEIKGFTKRLGIKFQIEDNLRALPPGQSIGLSWDDLVRRIENKRKRGPEPVLFICERNNIPERISPNWIDVAIANEFAGNALIGPKVDGVRPLGSLGIAEEEQRRKDFQEQLRNLFIFLKETQSLVICYDQSSEQALRLAHRMAMLPEGSFDELNIDKTISWNLPASARDFLFEKMWKDNQDAEADGRPERTFIIGSDFARAVASQTGAQTYFSRQEVLWLQKSQARANQSVLDSEAKVITHAVWNLGYPEGVERNHRLEQRIAGLAFFVAEYIRTMPDEFVTFIYDKIENLRRSHDGFRISQEIVRQVVKDCFNFYHFEHYGRLFYRHSSPQKYWVEEQPGLAAVHSRPIYFEMQNLRAVFFEKFRQYESLLTSSSGDKIPEDIRRQVRLAWVNYDVFNFADAVDIISDALDRIEA